MLESYGSSSLFFVYLEGDTELVWSTHWKTWVGHKARLMQE